MICLHCREPVLSGDLCPRCGQSLILFLAPPTKVAKASDVNRLSQSLKDGAISAEEVRKYLSEERAKLSSARKALVAGEEGLLEGGYASWQLALEHLQAWLDSGGEQDWLAALHWAVEADEKVNQSILIDFERRRDLVRQLQAQLKVEQDQVSSFFLTPE